MKQSLDMSDPLKQLAFLGLATLLVQLLGLLISSGSELDGGKTAWIISATFLLLFSFFNSTLQLRADNTAKYLSRSLYAFLGMIGLTIALGYALSIGSSFTFDSIRVIYLVIALCYVIFLIIVFLMRKIMEYAQRQDQEYEK